MVLFCLSHALTTRASGPYEFPKLGIYYPRPLAGHMRVGGMELILLFMCKVCFCGHLFVVWSGLCKVCFYDRLDCVGVL